MNRSEREHPKRHGPISERKVAMVLGRSFTALTARGTCRFPQLTGPSGRDV